MVFRPLPVEPSVHFSLPGSVGTIEDGWRAPQSDGKLIVLIQDAHTNDSGQMNLARALSVILPQENIRTVFTEAADGDVSLRFLRSQFSAEVLRDAGRKLVRRGIMKGSEYANLNGGQDFGIWGVEDPELYRWALLLYRQAVKRRQPAVAYLDRLERLAESLKADVYNPDLQVLDALHRRRLTGEIGIAEYFGALISMAGDQKTPLAAFPELQSLEALKRLEDSIDFAAVRSETKHALKALSAVDDRAFHELIQNQRQPEKWGDSKEVSNSYFLFLEEKLNASALKVREYPALLKYFEYLHQTARLNSARVLDEMTAMEDEAYGRLAVSPDERLLVTFAKNLRFLKNLLSLQSSPDEYAAFRRQAQFFDIRRISGFLNRKIMELDRHYDLAAPIDTDYEGAETAARAFYDLTYDRDQVFIDRMMSQMSKTGETRAVLVAGGFHAANLKDLLKRANISYVSILPRVLHETDTSHYEKLLLSQFQSRVRQIHPAESRKPVSAQSAMDGYIRQLGGKQEILMGELARSSGRPAQNFSRMLEASARGLAEEASGLDDSLSQPAVEGARLILARLIDNLYFTILRAQYDARMLEGHAPKTIGANFLLAALMSVKERLTKLHRIYYSDLAKDPELSGTDRPSSLFIRMIRTPLDAGVGDRTGRVKALAKALGIDPRHVPGRIATKSTDLFFDASVDGKNASGQRVTKQQKISIVEFNLLGMLAEIPLYDETVLQPLLSQSSEKVYEQLWNTVCLQDRVDDTILPRYKRTYRQLADERGLKIDKAFVQQKNPAIDPKTRKLSEDYRGPGGHAYLPFRLFLERPLAQVAKGVHVIRSIYNGDNAGHPDQVIARWMARDRVPIVMVTTRRTPVDEKVGLLGVEDLGHGKSRIAMLEAAEARQTGGKQWDIYSKAGLVEGKEYGEVGEQDTNTNDALINETVLYPFLEDLENRIGRHDFLHAIRPDLIRNIKKLQDGTTRELLEGAMGTVLLNLNDFVENNEQHRAVIEELKEKHGIKQLVRLVYIDTDKRTQMFSRIQNAFDFWLFTTNRYVLDALTGTIRNAEDRFRQLPFVDIQDPFYSEVDHVETAFGKNGSTRELKRISIQNVVLAHDADFAGTVKLVNPFPENPLDLHDPRYRRVLEKAGVYAKGKLILHDVEIALRLDGELFVFRPGESPNTPGAIERVTERSGEVKQVSAVGADWDKTIFHPTLDTEIGKVSLADYFAWIQATLMADRIWKPEPADRQRAIEKGIEVYHSTQGITDAERFAGVMREAGMAEDPELANSLADDANRELVDFLKSKIPLWENARNAGILIPGSVQIIEQLKKRFNVSGYIATAGQYPQRAGLVEALGLQDVFDGGIYGAYPQAGEFYRPDKGLMIEDIFRRAAEQEHVGTLLFFGDGSGDMKAVLDSRAAGVDIVGIGIAHTPGDVKKLIIAGADAIVHAYGPNEAAFPTAEDLLKVLQPQGARLAARSPEPSEPAGSIGIRPEFLRRFGSAVLEKNGPSQAAFLAEGGPDAELLVLRIEGISRRKLTVAVDGRVILSETPSTPQQGEALESLGGGRSEVSVFSFVRDLESSMRGVLGSVRLSSRPIEATFRFRADELIGALDDSNQEAAARFLVSVLAWSKRQSFGARLSFRLTGVERLKPPARMYLNSAAKHRYAAWMSLEDVPEAHRGLVINLHAAASSHQSGEVNFRQEPAGATILPNWIEAVWLPLEAAAGVREESGDRIGAHLNSTELADRFRAMTEHQLAQNLTRYGAFSLIKPRLNQSQITPLRLARLIQGKQGWRRVALKSHLVRVDQWLNAIQGARLALESSA